jgi:CRISPR-associated RAMP protein (TIGR02581 family)
MPYIPGSSFRGSLRAGLESLLRGVGSPASRVCSPFDKEGDEKSCAELVQAAREAERKSTRDIVETRAFELAWTNSCEVCKIFGHLFLASRVRVADLRFVSDPDDVPTYIRDGVGLDRDLRTAAGGILYNFEAIAAGARFELRLEIDNAADHELGLLLVGFDLFSEGFARIGGKSARGLGVARVENLAVTEKTAQGFFTGSKGTDLSPERLAALRAAARQYYVREREG